jgi:hypothetical protein
MAVIRATALIDLPPSAVLPYCLGSSSDLAWNARFVASVDAVLAAGDGLSATTEAEPVLKHVDEWTVRCERVADGANATLALSLSPVFGDATWLTGLLDLDFPDGTPSGATELKERSRALHRVLAHLKEATEADVLQGRVGRV